MPERAQIIRIVVASPSDVDTERATVSRVVDDLNKLVAADRGLRLEVIRWETDAYPGFHHEGPQGLIDRILHIEDCDVVIGIFWKRFGTPTKDGATGTEHEIRLAYERWQKSGRPQVMVYFNERPYAPKSRGETEQWGSVLDFKANFPKEGLWWPYKSTTEFGDLLRTHLGNFIRDKFPIEDRRPQDGQVSWGGGQSAESARAESGTAAPSTLAVHLPARGAEGLRTAAGPAPGTVSVNPKDGLKYVWIPPGAFEMGCSPGDTECFNYEKPAHAVMISKGFWLGQTPVTAAAYKRFVGETSGEMPPAPRFNESWNNEQMPIVKVTWYEALAYCKWAGGRLPTEAEWEYAVRAGSTEAHYGPLDEIAWYRKNSAGRTHEVGQRRPNGFGLYDMLGNVSEWVNDWYDEKYYQNSPDVDPSGPLDGEARVMRGASWLCGPSDLRATFRYHVAPEDRLDDVGFRCVRAVVLEWEELNKTMSNPRYAEDILKLDRIYEIRSVINRESVIVVVGTGVVSELLDRPVAELLRDQIDRTGKDYPFRRGVVLTDQCWYSRAADIGSNPVIAVGGPPANMLSDEFHKWTPPPSSDEGEYPIPGTKGKGFFRTNQKGLPQVALWGPSATGTREAVEHYLKDDKGLTEFLKMCWK